MNSSKFLFSTLIAAAAMTAPAYATTLDDAVFSVDSFTQDLVTSLGISGNVQGGVYTTGSGNVSIAKDKIDGVLTTNVQEGTTNRYTYSAIITVDASVFSTSGEKPTNGLIIGGGNSTVGAAYNGGDLYGAWGNGYWADGRNKSLDVSVTEGKITLGLVFTGGNSSGTKLYLLGQETQLIDSLKGGTDVSAIVLGGGISYSNLYWFNSALSSTDMQRNMSVVSGNTYRWAGTADGKWSDDTWESAGVIGSFVAGKDVLFDASTDVSKTITIDSEVTAGSMTVASDYVFNIGSTGSLAANSIVIDDNCVATLNLDSDKSLSSAVSGAGTLKKTGTGTLTLSGSVAQGSTVKVTSGTVFLNQANNTKAVSGNLTADGSNALIEWAAIGSDMLNYGVSNTMTAKNGGTIDFGSTRQTLNAGNKIVLANGGILEGTNGNGVDGETGDGYGALDFNANNTVLASGVDNEIRANIRLRGRNTVTFDVEEAGSLTVSGILNPNASDPNAYGHITKIGLGTLTLSGANANYNGTTTVSEGKLVAEHANALGTGAVVVNGGTLDVAVGTGATLMQVGAITTTGEGKITVSSGKLALTGAVNLSNAIENSGTVTVANTAVFALAGLNGVEGNSGTTYTLVSGTGETIFANDMGGANVNLAGTNFIARDASAIFSSGTVTVTGGTAGNIIWTGANNNTWDNATSSNWKVSSSDDSPTKFYNLDNVTFDGNNTVALVSGGSVNVGTMTVTAGTTTLSLASGTSSIVGKELTVASGATLQVGTGDLHSVKLEFDEGISVSGTLKYQNGATTWSSLNLEGGNLHLEDLTSGIGLSVTNLTVSGTSSMTANWDGTIAVGSLEGTGVFSLTGCDNGNGLTVNITNVDYTGTITTNSGSKGLTLNLGADGATSSANLTVNSGTVNVAGTATLGTLEQSGGTVNFNGSVIFGSSDCALSGNITIGENATVWATTGDALNYRDEGAEKTLTVQGTLNLGTDSNAEIPGGVRWSFRGNKNKLVLDGGKIYGSGDGHGYALDFFTSSTTKVTADSVIGANMTIRGGSRATHQFEVASGATLTISGNILAPYRDASDSDGLFQKTGEGNLILSGNNSTFTGGVDVSTGTLVAASENALGTGNVTVGEGATLSLGTDAVSVKNLSGAGKINLADGRTSAKLIVNSTVDTTFSGILTPEVNDGSRTLSLEKIGSGTLTLNSEGTLSAVSVTAGILAVDNPFALSDESDVSVSRGASLKVVAASPVEGYATSVGTLTLDDGAILKVAVDLTSIDATGEDIMLNIVAASVIKFGDALTLGGDVQSRSQIVDLPEGYIDLEISDDFKNYTQTWNYANGTLSLTLAIPEPSLFGLLAGLGALTLVGTRRRRGKKA